MTDKLIIMNDLTKVYKSSGEEVPALKGVDLEIVKGDSLAFMGHSGSGKSTLLSILGGLNPPTTGKVVIDDIDIYSLSQEKRADFRREYIGFVFQQFQLIPYLTAIENIMLPLTTTKYPAKKKKEMTENVLSRVGLSNKGKRLPSQLSGGEQERIAIARAIVNDPPLVLADEPTGSLDTTTGEEIMNLFADLNKEGLTVLMVTHNSDNTSYMNRTIFMKDGKISDDKVENLRLVKRS